MCALLDTVRFGAAAALNGSKARRAAVAAIESRLRNLAVILATLPELERVDRGRAALIAYDVWRAR